MDNVYSKEFPSPSQRIPDIPWYLPYLGASEAPIYLQPGIFLLSPVLQIQFFVSSCNPELLDQSAAVIVRYLDSVEGIYTEALIRNSSGVFE